MDKCNHKLYDMYYSQRERGYMCCNCGKRVSFFRELLPEQTEEKNSEIFIKRRLYSENAVSGRISF